MTREDIHKLIGGYATGSLSEAERKALFEAALDDQDLFDELAREQALKETLEEPGAKQRLIAGLAPQPQRTWWRQQWPWLAFAGAIALAAVIANVILVRPPEKREIAQTRAPELRSAPAEPAARESAPPKPASAKASLRRDAPSPVEPKVTPPAELRKEVAEPPAQDAIATAKDAAPANAVEADKADKKEAAAVASVAAPQPPAIRAAAPAPNAFRGAVGGFVGGGGGGARAQQTQQGQAGVTSLASAPRFSFIYSVTPEGNLRIQPISDGFLTVIVNKAASDTQVLLSGQATKAGSSVDVPVPAGSTQATIVYSAQSVPAGTVTGSLAAQDPPSGTKTDPAPSPNSRLQAVIPLTPRE